MCTCKGLLAKFVDKFNCMQTIRMILAKLSVLNLTFLYVPFKCIRMHDISYDITITYKRQVVKVTIESKNILNA